jgi:hypothetical protein
LSGAGKYTKGNYYLAFVFFLLGILGLNSPTALNSIHPTIGILIFPSSQPLNLLIGPFFYFYFRFVIKKIPFKFSSDYKHLLIFFISMVNMIPFHWYSFQAKIKIYENFLVDAMSPFNIKLLFVSLSNMYLVIDVVIIFYLILCFMFLMENKVMLKNSLNSDGFQTIKNWLIWLYSNFLILFFINIIVAVRVFYLGHLPETYYFHVVALALLTLNIKLYQFPAILYGIKLGSANQKTKINLVHQSQKKYHFDEDFRNRFRLILHELAESKELFQDNFIAQSMAEKLGISSNVLGQFLKEEHKINFAQLVSKTRVQIFMDSVEPADFKKYSISGLIKLYGFKSIKQLKTDLEKYATEDYDLFIAKMKNNG